MNDSTAMLYDANKRGVGASYALWFFFGWLGAHRFYTGYKTSGALMVALACYGWYRVIFVEGAGLLALIVLAIWVLVDAALIPSMVRKANIQTVRDLSAD